jgi:endonuclease YncB( thermonuclease family)
MDVETIYFETEFILNNIDHPTAMKTLLSILTTLVVATTIATATPESGRVIAIVDYRTIVVTTADSTSLTGSQAGDTVRLIGIAPRTGGDVSDEDLAGYLSVLVGGVRVLLVNDPTISDLNGGNYRYVFVDGTNINRQLILDGYALASQNERYAELASFQQAERDAAKRLGTWTSDDVMASDVSIQ